MYVKSRQGAVQQTILGLKESSYKLRLEKQASVKTLFDSRDEVLIQMQCRTANCSPSQDQRHSDCRDEVWYERRRGLHAPPSVTRNRCNWDT